MSSRLTLNRRDFSFSLAGAVKRGTDKVDVAVIGAGVFGSWIALECHRRRMSVMLIDCRGPANSLASSGGESRILRVGYGPQEDYSLSARDSLARWRETLSALGQTSLFVPSGVLWVGPAADPYLNATCATLKKLAVSYELMGAAQIRRRYPQINVQDGLLGLFEPGSGYVLARRAVQAIVNDLIVRGVRYRQAMISAPLPALSGRVTEISAADGGTIRASAFIFACGPWLTKLFPGVLKGCITPTRQEVFFMAVPPGDSAFCSPKMPAWIDFRTERIFYGVPDSEQRGFKVAAIGMVLRSIPTRRNGFQQRPLCMKSVSFCGSGFRSSRRRRVLNPGYVSMRTVRQATLSSTGIPERRMFGLRVADRATDLSMGPPSPNRSGVRSPAAPRNKGSPWRRR